MPQKSGAQQSPQEQNSNVVDFAAYRRQQEIKASGAKDEGKGGTPDKASATAKGKEKTPRKKSGGGAGGEGGGGDDKEKDTKKKIAAREKSLREQLGKYALAETPDQEEALEEKINKIADELLALGVDVLKSEKWQKLFEKAGIGAVDDEAPEEEGEAVDAEILDEDENKDPKKEGTNEGGVKEFKMKDWISALAGSDGEGAVNLPTAEPAGESTVETTAEESEEFAPFDVNAQEEIETIERSLGVDDPNDPDVEFEAKERLRAVQELDENKRFTLKKIKERFLYVVKDVNKIKAYIEDRQGARRMAGEMPDEKESKGAQLAIRQAEQFLTVFFEPSIEAFKHILFEERTPQPDAPGGYGYKGTRSPADIPHDLRPRLVYSLAKLEEACEERFKPIINLLSEDPEYTGERPVFLGKDTAQKNEIITNGSQNAAQQENEKRGLVDVIGPIARPEDANGVLSALSEGTLYVRDVSRFSPAVKLIYEEALDLMKKLREEYDERKQRMIKSEIVNLARGRAELSRGFKETDADGICQTLFEIHTPEQQPFIDALDFYCAAVDEKLLKLTEAREANYQAPGNEDFYRELETHQWTNLTREEKREAAVLMLQDADLENPETIRAAAQELAASAEQVRNFVATLHEAQEARHLMITERPTEIPFFDNNPKKGMQRRQALIASHVGKAYGRVWTPEEQQREAESFVAAKSRLWDALIEAYLFEMGGREGLQEKKAQLEAVLNRPCSEAEVIAEWRDQLVTQIGTAGLRDDLYHRLDVLINSEMSAHGVEDRPAMYIPGEKLDQREIFELEMRDERSERIDLKRLNDEAWKRLQSEVLLWDAIFMWDQAAHQLEQDNLDPDYRKELIAQMAYAHSVISRTERRVEEFVEEKVYGTKEKGAIKKWWEKKFGTPAMRSRFNSNEIVTGGLAHTKRAEAFYKAGNVEMRHGDHPPTMLADVFEYEGRYFAMLEDRDYKERQLYHKSLGLRATHFKELVVKEGWKALPVAFAGGSVAFNVAEGLFAFSTGSGWPGAALTYAVKGLVLTTEFVFITAPILHAYRGRGHKALHHVAHEGLHAAKREGNLLAGTIADVENFWTRFLKTRNLEDAEELTPERLPVILGAKNQPRALWQGIYKKMMEGKVDREGNLKADKGFEKSIRENLLKALADHYHHIAEKESGGHGGHGEKKDHAPVKYMEPSEDVVERHVELTKMMGEVLAILKKMKASSAKTFAEYERALDSGSQNPVREGKARIAVLKEQVLELTAWSEKLTPDGRPESIEKRKVDYTMVVALKVRLEQLLHENIDYYRQEEYLRRNKFLGPIDCAKLGWKIPEKIPGWSTYEHVTHEIMHFIEHKLGGGGDHGGGGHGGGGKKSIGILRGGAKLSVKALNFLFTATPRVVGAAVGILPITWIPATAWVHKKMRSSKPKDSVMKAILAEEKQGFFEGLAKGSKNNVYKPVRNWVYREVLRKSPPADKEQGHGGH